MYSVSCIDRHSRNVNANEIEDYNYQIVLLFCKLIQLLDRCHFPIEATLCDIILRLFPAVFTMQFLYVT